MNSRNTLFLFVGALVAGIAAAFLGNQFINTKIEEHKANLDKQYESIGIVVPNQDLRKGTVLDKSVLSVRNVPRSFIHKDTVMPEFVDDIISYQLVFPVNAGEALLLSHISKARGQGFSSLIEEGKRALTFPVDIIKSVSGMLRPGDRIDLLMTIEDNQTKKTLPLLTDVNILATGSQVDEEFNGNGEAIARYQTITLSVSSENASRIIHADQASTLSVILRSPGDEELGFQKAMTNDVLLGKQKKATGKRRPRIKIIRGGK